MELPKNHNNTLLKKILDVSPSGVCYVGTDLTIGYANTAFADLHQETGQTLTGKHLSELYTEGTFQTCAKQFVDGVNGEAQDFNIPLFTSGHPVGIAVKLVPDFDDDGNAQGAFAHFSSQSQNVGSDWPYNAVFNAIPGRICLINRDYEVLHANEDMRKTYPRLNENRIARLDEFVPAANWPTAQEQIELAFKGQNTHFKNIVQIKGKKTSVAIYLAPIKSVDQSVVLGVYILVLDETELTVTRTQLHRTERNLALALRSHMIAFWELDQSKGDWIYAEHIERLLGLPQGNLNNSVKQFLQLVHPDDQGQVFLNNEAERLPEDSCVNEFRCRTATGEYRWFRLIGNQGKRQGEDAIQAGTIADINDLKNAEILAANRLEYRDSFLSMLSHELRNPVAGIQYAMDVFSETTENYQRLPPEAKTSVGIVKRQTTVISRLLNDLLNVSRVSHNQIRYEDKSLCLRELLGDVVESAKSICLAKQQQIVFSCEAKSATIHGDLVRLTQAFTNLIDNASKFSQPHSQIEVSCRIEGKSFITCVSDCGGGIAAEALGTIFDLFFQEEQPLDRNASGLGIGLYLVKRIVDAHQGAVSVVSPGKLGGCDFEVRLPITSTTHQPATEKLPLTNSLVLVEDNEDSRIALTLALKSRGFDVTCLADGKQAVEKIPGLKPKTVLIDIGLPGKNGMKVVRELRKHKRLADTFFIALTGYGQQHEREMILESGFDNHMTKPVDIGELCSLIASRTRS